MQKGGKIVEVIKFPQHEDLNWKRIELKLRKYLSSKCEDEDVINHVLNALNPIAIEYLNRIDAYTPRLRFPNNISSDDIEVVMTSFEDTLKTYSAGFAEGTLLFIYYILDLECELYKLKNKQD